MSRPAQLQQPATFRRQKKLYGAVEAKSHLASSLKLKNELGDIMRGKFASIDDQTLFHLTFLFKFTGNMLAQQERKLSKTRPGLHNSRVEDKEADLFFEQHPLSTLPVMEDTLIDRNYREARGKALTDHFVDIHRDVRNFDIETRSDPDFFPGDLIFPVTYRPSAKTQADDAHPTFVTVDPTVSEEQRPHLGALNDQNLHRSVSQMMAPLNLYIDDLSGVYQSDCWAAEEKQPTYGRFIRGEWAGFLTLFTFYDILAKGDSALEAGRKQYLNGLLDLMPMSQTAKNHAVGVFLYTQLQFIGKNRAQLENLLGIELNDSYSGKNADAPSREVWEKNVKGLRQHRNKLILHYVTKILSSHLDYALFSLCLYKQNEARERCISFFTETCRKVISQWEKAIDENNSQSMITRVLDKAISEAEAESGGALYNNYCSEFDAVYLALLKYRNTARIMWKDIQLFIEQGGWAQDMALDSIFLPNAGSDGNALTRVVNRFCEEYERLERDPRWQPPSSSWDLPSPTYFCYEALQYIFRLMETEIATAKDRLKAECTLEGHPGQEGMKEGRISEEGMKEGRISEEGMEEEQVIEGQQQEKFYPIIARLSAYAKTVSPLDPEAKSNDNANGRLYDEIKKGLQLCYETGQYHILTILFLNLFLPKWSENPNFEIIDDVAELKDTEVAIIGDESLKALISKCGYFLEESTRITVLTAILETIISRYSVRNILLESLDESGRDVNEYLSDLILSFRGSSIIDLHIELFKKVREHFQSAEDAVSQPGAPEPGELTPSQPGAPEPGELTPPQPGAPEPGEFTPPAFSLSM